MKTTIIKCGAVIGEASALLAGFFWDDPERFILLLGEKFSHRINPFERRVIETEMERLKEFGTKKKFLKGGPQLALL